MANIKINNLQAANLNPSTSELFNELTEAEISDIHGGWWFASKPKSFSKRVIFT
jgi:hypothetical protein